MSTTIGCDHVVNLVTGIRIYSTPLYLVSGAQHGLRVGRQSIRLQHEPWPSFLLSVE